MKRVVLMMVVLVLLSQATICGAQDRATAIWTGNNLLRKLTTGTRAEKLTSQGFVLGSAFTYLQLQQYGKMPKVFEISEDVTEGQVIDVVTGFVRAHPESRHFMAPLLVLMALEQAFPAMEFERVR